MNQRTYYLDILRLLATIAVIMLHVSVIFMRGNSVAWYAGTIYNSVSRWCVPVFLMISGALFLQPAKLVSLKKLYGKYILRLIVALIAWQLLYTFVFDPFRPILLSLLHGKPIVYHMGNWFPMKYHLWFLPMIIGVYVLMPIFKLIVTNRKLIIYYLILWILFEIYDFVHSVSIAEADWLWYAIDSLQIRMFYGYSGYFLLGYYLSTIKLSPAKWWISVFVFVVACGITAVFGALGWGKYVWEDLAPNVIAMSVSIFICSRYICEEKQHKYLSGFVNHTRGDLFGIYLIHPFFLSLYPFFSSFLGPLSFLLIPVFVCVIFVLSLYTIKVMRMIPYLKYICS